MNAFLIGGVILVAILVIWLALQSLQGRQKSGAIESQMNELRRDLQTIATSQAQSTGQLETIAKNVAQRLDSVAPALQEAIKNSAQITGQMTSDAQTKMAGELKNTRDQISQIQLQLGEVQQAGRQKIDGHRFEVPSRCLSQDQRRGRGGAPGLRRRGEGALRHHHQKIHRAR